MGKPDNGSRKVFTTLGARNYAIHERAENDFYSTDHRVTEALLDVETFYPEILEPACGDGAMAKVLEDAGYEVQSSDITYRGWGLVKDFFHYTSWHGDIVTNPPFNISERFVRHALDIIPEGGKVAMLLRLQFLEGQSRRRLFEEQPPRTVYVFSKRQKTYRNGDIKKYGNMQSALALAWFVWTKGYKSFPIIKWL